MSKRSFIFIYSKTFCTIGSVGSYSIIPIFIYNRGPRCIGIKVQDGYYFYRPILSLVMTVPAFSKFSTCFDSKNQTTKICHWQVLVWIPFRQKFANFILYRRHPCLLDHELQTNRAIRSRRKFDYNFWGTFFPRETPEQRLQFHINFKVGLCHVLSRQSPEEHNLRLLRKALLSRVLLSRFSHKNGQNGILSKLSNHTQYNCFSSTKLNLVRPDRKFYPAVPVLI